MGRTNQNHLPLFSVYSATFSMHHVVHHEAIGSSGEIRRFSDQGFLHRLVPVQDDHLLAAKQEAVDVTVATGQLGTEGDQL